MPELHTALEVPLEEDILPLSALLHQRGVPHRVVEEGGRQALKVVDEAHIAGVKEAYQRWRGGEFELQVKRVQHPVGGTDAFAAAMVAPITLSLVLVST